MSLLPQAKLDTLSPEEMWATNADTPSSFKEYLGLSFGQGIEESALGAATSVGPDYQPPMSGGIFGQPAVQQPSGTPKLSEDQWKASKNYRQEIPYDPGMTEARAEFLRQQFDRRRWRDSVYERYQGGLMGRAAGIGAMLAGGALAPENYIPILGPASRAYMAARLGRVGAYAAVGAAEGAIGNLAVAPYIYQGLAAQGEDVGVEDVALDVAMGAVLGSAFSTGVGVVGDRLARSRAMREAAVSGRGATVHTAADALNLAADAVERGDVPDVARVVAPEVERVGGLRRQMAVAMRQAAPDEPGIDVWHGSPHKFDRFDVNRIGTGEGGQAYGYGLYFAESPDVARSYQRDLSNKITVDGKTLLDANKRGGGSTGDKMLDDYLVANAGDLPVAIDEIRSDLAALEANSRANPNDIEQMRSLLGRAEQLQKADAVKSSFDGSLYKVRLRVDPDQMLDWDKPLGQQSPHVKAALQKLDGADLPENMGAGEWMQAREAAVGKRTAANQLADAGIPGIRFLDQQSRRAGEGSRNYVVFDDARTRITEIDGRPLDPDPEPPSVTEAAARVGKDTPELQQFAEDMGLEDSSVVDMDLNELRRAGTLTAEDEAALQAAADDVKMAESVALSYETLSTCVLRYGT